MSEVTLELCSVLICISPDPTITNHRGHDAIYEAELNDKDEVVKWVLKEGGDGLEEGLGGDAGDAGEGDDGEITEEDTEESAAESTSTPSVQEDATKMVEKLGQIDLKDIGLSG